MSERLRDELARVASELGADPAEYVLERPRDAGHGDLATNLAMVLGRKRKTNPRALAQEIIERLRLPATVASKVEIAGPGFINFWLADDQLADALRTILAAEDRYGRSETGAAVRVNVEFVSANPTGPLHVGHGRGAALGDAIAALLEWTGHEVTREFYINDAGAQIDLLSRSLWARIQQVVGRDMAVPDGGYQGEYLRELADEVVQTRGVEVADLSEADGLALSRTVALASQRAEQDELLRDFGVRFDVHSSEWQLYEDGRVGRALVQLGERGLTFEAEGALWLRTSEFGDDKDRVLRKSDGTYTYLVPDIAYHVDKHDRGFDRAIDIWGADHHGYIGRLQAALRALGYSGDFLEVQIVQLVKVMKGGEEVRMSKRAGDYVTLRDLLDWVGRDAARYFFLTRRGETPFVFDVDLAIKQTEENPVFYVQMAHARMSGIFRVAGIAPEDAGAEADVLGLTAPEDVELLKALTGFPEVVERAAAAREPHRVTSYLEDLARLAHAWYHHCRVLGEPPLTERARLVLARAARTVLGTGLRLLGLTAPDRM